MHLAAASTLPAGLLRRRARKVMRQRVLVVAQDVALRSALARCLMPAGYFVEVAESDRRAREVLADRRMALTIVAATPDAAGAPTFDPGEKGGKLVIVTDRSQDLSPLTRSTRAADGYLSLPLDENEVLARVQAVLQPQAEAPPATEILSFEGFKVDLAGRSLCDCDGN